MNNSISNKILREFGVLMGIGIPFFIGWIIPALWGHSFRPWTLLIGICCLIIGIFAPRLIFYPYRVWMKLGYVLGWINSRIILGIIFLIVLLPIAFIMKLFKYDPLRLKKSDQKSYRENIENKNIDLKRIF